MKRRRSRLTIETMEKAVKQVARQRMRLATKQNARRWSSAAMEERGDGGARRWRSAAMEEHGNEAAHLPQQRDNEAAQLDLAQSALCYSPLPTVLS